jgi:hypothetical protein
MNPNINLSQWINEAIEDGEFIKYKDTPYIYRCTLEYKGYLLAFNVTSAICTTVMLWDRASGNDVELPSYLTDSLKTLLTHSFNTHKWALTKSIES